MAARYINAEAIRAGHCSKVGSRGNSNIGKIRISWREEEFLTNVDLFYVSDYEPVGMFLAMFLFGFLILATRPQC